MSKVLVTGVAGFLGSHLATMLVQQGYKVVGVDSFTDYYSRNLKEANLAPLLNQATQYKRFEFGEFDLYSDDYDQLPSDIDTVVHLAGQPGVRGSWGDTFDQYVRDNILATQRLLEHFKDRSLNSFVYASSSSVYGNKPGFTQNETMPCFPVSPYGVTKLAVESLCGAYRASHGVPVVGLRFFTAYGERQRPDMAFSRFFHNIMNDVPITIYGDGRQTRDFTYAGDVCEGITLAMKFGKAGQVYNIGSGRPVVLQHAIEAIQEITGKRARVVYRNKQLGDMADTACDTSKARRDLFFTAKTTLFQGLTKQYDAIKTNGEVVPEVPETKA